MKRKILLSVILIVVLILSSGTWAAACTIFTAETDDGTILACNHEDWMYSTHNKMEIKAKTESSYGYVCFYNSSYVQGGMNEYGLFYDGASCPSMEVPYDPEKETLGFDAGEVVLANCKTVKEVQEFLSQYNISSGFNDHLLFADVSGDSAVFEWIGDQVSVIHKADGETYQVATNFWLSDPDRGGYPCERYETVTTGLKDHEVTFESCRQLLVKTKQDWGDGGTLYSNIYDLTNQEVYVYARGDMYAVYHFSLKNELSTLTDGEVKSVGFEDLDFVSEDLDTQETINQEEVQNQEENLKIAEKRSETVKSDQSGTCVVMLTIAGVLIVAGTAFFVIRYRRSGRK